MVKDLVLAKIQIPRAWVKVNLYLGLEVKGALGDSEGLPIVKWLCKGVDQFPLMARASRKSERPGEMPRKYHNRRTTVVNVTAGCPIIYAHSL